jgi:hypothetical protein
MQVVVAVVVIQWVHLALVVQVVVDVEVAVNMPRVRVPELLELLIPEVAAGVTESPYRFLTQPVQQVGRGL